MDLVDETLAAPLAPLAPLLGRWATAGISLAADGSSSGTFAGHDTYEVLPGGGWVVHTVDVVSGGEAVRALELIGDPRPDGSFAMRAFDGSGAYDEMHLSVEGGVFLGRGGSMRFELRPAGDTLAATWEREDGGAWRPWMELTLTREAAAGTA